MKTDVYFNAVDKLSALFKMIKNSLRIKSPLPLFFFLFLVKSRKQDLQLRKAFKEDFITERKVCPKKGPLRQEESMDLAGSKPVLPF